MSHHIFISCKLAQVAQVFAVVFVRYSPLYAGENYREKMGCL